LEDLLCFPIPERMLVAHAPIEPPLRSLIAGGCEMDRTEALVGVLLRRHGRRKRRRGRRERDNGGKPDLTGHESLPGSPRGPDISSRLPRRRGGGNLPTGCGTRIELTGAICYSAALAGKSRA